MSTRQRLLFYLPQLYPAKVGGLEVFAAYFVRELGRRRPLIVISDTPCQGAAKRLSAWRRKPLKLTALLRLWTLFLRYPGKNSVFYFSYSTGFHPWWMRSILLARRFLKIKYVVTIHSGRLEKWRPFGTFRDFFVQADALTAVSEKLCGMYEERCGRTPRFIPPLIPFDAPEANDAEVDADFGIPSGATVVLFAGSLKPLKSPETLERAAELLGREYLETRNVCVVFAGDGPLKKALAERVAAAGLELRVKIPGNVPRERLCRLFGRARIYVSCSEYEGLSVSLQEAMFHALACVVADSPGLNTVITDGLNGALFPFGDAEALAEKLKLAIEEPSRRGQWGRRAKEASDGSFNYGDMLDEWCGVFDALAEAE